MPAKRKSTKTSRSAIKKKRTELDSTPDDTTAKMREIGVEMDADEIKTKIAALREQDDPYNKCEGKIRLLYDKIQELENVREKEKLLDELQEVACYGLSEDLKQMLENKGLLDEFALELVKERKTTLPVLAKYLYKSKEDKQKTLVDIREKIGEETEVLGGLIALGIRSDIKKKWVKNLYQKAPSLLSLRLLSRSEINRLCDGASEGEMGVVSELIMVANAAKQSEFPSPPGFDANLRLNKAKKMINEARKHLSETPEKENKTEISEKVDIICQTLCLLPHWRKQELASPEERLNRLEHITQQISSVAESQEAYSSNVDLVTKVSGGLALCGVYYSEYDTPTTAGLPILLPPTSVSLLHPSLSISESYIKFTRQGAATEYVKKVASSGINVGASLKASEDIIIEKLVGGHLRGDKDTSEHTSVKSANTSVSVLKSTSTTKKEFRLDVNEMNLCPAAKELALSIAKPEKSGDNARSFMQRYGSHVPAGSHKLGGIFYSIVDAVSDTRIEISKFANTAVEKLQARISASLGVGASGTADHENSSDKAEESRSAEERALYEFSKEVIGPQASNPETFEPLLAYNSTWAIIDRGPSGSYIPVWELARKQGSEFEQAADILEQTWKEDEEIKKKNWEEHKKKIEEQRRQEIIQAMEEEIMNELTKIEKVLINVDFEDKTYRLTNVKSVYRTTFRSLLIYNLGKAFAEAKEFIAKDPDYNICAISISDSDGKSCNLECFKAASDSAVKFKEIGSEKQVFYYSENRFKWNDRLPRRTVVDKNAPYRIWESLGSLVSKLFGLRHAGFHVPNAVEIEIMVNYLQQGRAENSAPF